MKYLVASFVAGTAIALIAGVAVVRPTDVDDIIAVSVQELDFGILSGYEPIERSFTVRNISKRRAVIDVIADCGCVQFTPNHAILEPGNTTAIKSAFHPLGTENSGTPGSSTIQKQAVVQVRQASGKQCYKAMPCSASVFQPLAIDPVHLSHSVSIGSSEDYVTIPIKSAASVVAVSVLSYPEAVRSAHIEHGGASYDYILTVGLNEITSVADVRCNIELGVVTSASTSYHDVVVPVVLNPRKPFSITPAVAELTSGHASVSVHPEPGFAACNIVSATADSTEHVALDLSGGAPLNIHALDADDMVNTGVITVRVECISDDGRRHVLADYLTWVSR